MTSLQFSMPTLQERSQVRVVERLSLPPGEVADFRIQFPGQRTWIRATPAQAEHAFMLGFGVRADVVTERTVER